MSFRVGAPHSVSSPCQVWCSYALWEWRYKNSCKYGFFTANARYLLLYVSLLLPFLFSVKYMACHVPKVSQTTSQGIIFMETSISVPMK